MLTVLNGASHMAFTDLALILLLEMRLCYFIPTFTQAFRGRYNMRLIADLTRAFFIKNGIAKESGNYTDLVKRLEATDDITFTVY